jgi:hypothetical protein
MYKLLVLIFSVSAFSCTQSELEIQQRVFSSLITKYKADKKEPLKSIRKIDFFPGKRARFLYITTKASTKNAIENYQVDDNCQISFKQLKF